MSKKKMYKTTDKQLKYFEKKVRYWQDFLGVKGWRIDVDMGDIGENYAQTEVNHPGKCCTIRLSSSNGFKICDEQLNKTAFHEVCEVLFANLSGMAEQLFASSVVEEEVHSIIRTLENSIFKK